MTTASTSTSTATTTFFFTLKYRDARRAHAWLQEAFGFQPGAIFAGEKGQVAHAEMYFGSGGVMFGSADTGLSTPDDAYSRPGVYAVVEDSAIDAHYERAKAAGAEITRELRDTEYGSREYTALDFEGNPWSFGTYLPERSVSG